MKKSELKKGKRMRKSKIKSSKATLMKALLSGKSQSGPRFDPTIRLFAQSETKLALHAADNRSKVLFEAFNDQHSVLCHSPSDIYVDARQSEHSVCTQ